MSAFGDGPVLTDMLRRTLRFPLLLALCALSLPPALVARFLAALGFERRALELAAWTQRAWGRATLRVVGVELTLAGTPPPEACLVVANHLSYLDIPVLAAVFPGRFVAKSEIRSWPFLGPLVGLIGTIFVTQKRHRDMLRVQHEMTRTLAAGVPILLFPEGHSTRGLGVDRLHSSLLECAANAGIPCLAVALGYETPRDPWAPAATICWWGGMPFWRHAWGLTGLRRIRARVSVAPGARTGSDRKALAEALHGDLCSRFEPVRQDPIAPDCPWGDLFGRPVQPGPSRAPGAGATSAGAPTAVAKRAGGAGALAAGSAASEDPFARP